MRSVRHWTPPYVRARARLWWHEQRNGDWPWLTRDAVDFLDGWIRPSDYLVEFGSGRSTVWFARRVSSMLSVEHDPSWHARTSQMLASEGTDSKVRYILCQDSREYVALPTSLHNVDLCLVDGIHRGSVAVGMVRAMTPGSGVLVIDNANWYLPPRRNLPFNRGRKTVGEPVDSDWEEFEKAVRHWRCYWTSNGVTDTALFFCPASQ